MTTPNLQPVLTGKLLKTEPLQETDYEGLYQVAVDPLIWEQHPDSKRYQREVFAKSFFHPGVLIVKDLKTDEIIGSSRFYDFSPEQSQIKIGYTFLIRKYWGGDYNRELKHLMLTYAFEFVDSVTFEIGEINLRSQKAIEKIGATLVEKKETPASSHWCSCTWIYRINKAEFIAAPKFF